MTTEELSQIHDTAMEYCFKRLKHNKIRKRVWKRAVSLKKYPGVITERVNVPGVGQSICEYHLYTKPKMGSLYFINVSFHIDDALIMVTDNCYSSMTDGSVEKKEGKFFVALHSHAIDRFIERHHFNGTHQEAEEYILLNYQKVPYKSDVTTSEVICPFDNGVFLGYENDGKVVHLKTYVMNRQLFINQRLDEVKAKQFGEEVTRTIL